MANYQNNMRYSRRPMQSMQPAQLPRAAAAKKQTDARIRMIISPPICQSAWLMFPGRNGRRFTNHAKVWRVELFLKNWINRSSVKEVCADE